jgi:uncharacterized membrane protein
MPNERRGRGWLGLLLFLSVAFNLFLGGVLLGRAAFSPLSWDTAALEINEPQQPNANGDRPAGVRGANPESRLADRVRALPFAERRRFMAALGQQRADLQEARRSLRAAVIHVGQVIAAPQLDQQALSQALADVRVATTHEQETLHRALGPALAALSPESRARIAGRAP